MLRRLQSCWPNLAAARLAGGHSISRPVLHAHLERAAFNRLAPQAACECAGNVSDSAAWGASSGVGLQHLRAERPQARRGTVFWRRVRSACAPSPPPPLAREGAASAPLLGRHDRHCPCGLRCDWVWWQAVWPHAVAAVAKPLAASASAAAAQPLAVAASPAAAEALAAAAASSAQGRSEGSKPFGGLRRPALCLWRRAVEEQARRSKVDEGRAGPARAAAETALEDVKGHSALRRHWPWPVRVWAAS